MKHKGLESKNPSLHFHTPRYSPFASLYASLAVCVHVRSRIYKNWDGALSGAVWPLLSVIGDLESKRSRLEAWREEHSEKKLFGFLFFVSFFPFFLSLYLSQCRALRVRTEPTDPSQDIADAVQGRSMGAGR